MVLGAAPQSARCVSSCIDSRKRLLCMVFCPPRPTPSAVRDGLTTCSGEPPAGHGRSSVDHACLGRQLMTAKTQVQSCYHPKPYHRRSIWGRQPGASLARIFIEPVDIVQHLHAPARRYIAARHSRHAFAIHRDLPSALSTRPHKRAPGSSAHRTPRTRAPPVLIPIGASAFGRRASACTDRNCIVPRPPVAQRRAAHGSQPAQGPNGAIG